MTKLNNTTWFFKPDSVERYAYWNNFFSVEECNQLIKTVKANHQLNTALINVAGSGGTEVENVTGVRDSNVVFLYPNPDYNWVYQRLTDVVNSLNSQYFNFDLYGFVEGLQFTEYVGPTGKYDLHVDKVYKGSVRKLTIVIQLTDESEYDGGELQIVDSSNPEPMLRTQGRLLAFPSYTPHCVTPVTRGTRYSLVGWITGPQFK